MTTQLNAHTTKRDPRQPQLDRAVASRLASTEYERVADLLASLSLEQWNAPTDCPGWDVRAMAGHMLGMVQMVSSLPRLARQQVVASRRAKRGDGVLIDALTALQVERNAGLSTDQVVDQVRRLGPRAARFRARALGLMRSQTTQDHDEWWTLGYLFDVVLTRDPFMHRVDISRATGVPMVATADHEGVIVADVVAEWAGRHLSAYDLELTGPAGGHWQQGEAEPLRMDAFEFCRAVSGRAAAPGLLATQVPF
jgi:uncharacterized protein (TIGR03083 family)